MADNDSPPSSDLSDPPSIESDHDDQLSVAGVSRPGDGEVHAPPSKRRKTAHTAHASYDRADSTGPADPVLVEDPFDNISLSSDGFSSAPGSPAHDERNLREEAQLQCLWRDCQFGFAINNDELVQHVQSTHCSTGGPKKTKYICEWGECQRKTSHHPSGYALKAHMRSHTKEKPYYCALPECDKAFTRSDALAKHMRTVHEPDIPRSLAGAAGLLSFDTANTTKSSSIGGGKGNKQPKLTNGTATKSETLPPDTPTHDEFGTPIVNPSPASDNITYIPAYHPITGQPGFMIHYPSDIHFSAWESSIPADQLMKLLRRQVHWAEQESEELHREVAILEAKKKEEFVLKEILLEGVMEAEWERGWGQGRLAIGEPDIVDDAGGGGPLQGRMYKDVQPAKELKWVPKSPRWRRNRYRKRRTVHEDDVGPVEETVVNDDATVDADPETPGADDLGGVEDSPSPPPTGKSGGFDGDQDPYDNFVGDQMATFERLRAEKAANRSMQSTPQKQRQEQTEAEADAVGALLELRR